MRKENEVEKLKAKLALAEQFVDAMRYAMVHHNVENDCAVVYSRTISNYLVAYDAIRKELK